MSDAKNRAKNDCFLKARTEKICTRCLVKTLQIPVFCGWFALGAGRNQSEENTGIYNT